MDPKKPEDGDADPAAEERGEERRVEVVSTKSARRDSTLSQIVALRDDIKESRSPFRKAAEALRKIPGKLGAKIGLTKPGAKK